MRTHTTQFKENIKKFGKELDSVIRYSLNDETIELGGEELNSVSLHYQGGILKSVMKQLDIDSNVEIPLGTILTYQFGVKVGNGYEYINYGNYAVYSVEKQEDTGSWKITCYDKMLYAMKDYENMQITYPQTIRSYINALCNKMGLTFANNEDTFANYDKTIVTDLYEGLGYTIRDVLDELAQATASTICINDNDELEIRYINDTGDTIDEEYLKDVNVNFGEMTKPINTIVLSRAGGSDKIYLSYPEDLSDDEKVSIEIADNQIMNFNDRDTYLPDILNKLLGLTYSLNDYSSTGICYYDLCDKYNVSIGENIYPCIMFNDEINVTQGLEELVYTELPEETETDYTKADKTDRRINQTYIIVDKQNQRIDSVVSSVGEQNNKISQITQTVDEINSKISDIADITISGESNFATFTLDNINESEPIQIKVKPISENISYLYPHNNLYPSSNLFSKVRTIRFHNNTTNTNVDYILPDDLLYYDANTYDEFYLDYDSQTCQVTKRCKYNADGTVSLLATEQVVDYPYPTITLEDGDYTLTLLGYEYGYLFVRLMAKNIYTSQFYTKAETESRINQKANEIDLGVSQRLSNYSTTSEMNSAINIKANEISSVVSTKVGNNEIISKINQTPEQITINANKLNLQGYITASDLSGNGTTTINGSNITTGEIKSSNYQSGTSGTKINLNDGSIDTKGFKVSSTGNMTATSGNIAQYVIDGRKIKSTDGKAGMASSTTSGDPVFWAGYGDPWEHSDWASKIPFYVTNQGYLKATNANISGSIYSSSGTIGGWNLSSSGLSSTSGGYFVGITPGYLSASVGGEIEDRLWWKIVVGDPSDKKVKHDINNINNKYEKFYNNLIPVSFKYNDEFEDRKKESLHFGFVAQDIEKNIKDNNLEDLAMIYGNKLLKLNKEEIIALNTWQIQKLKEEIKELKKEMEELKNG